MRYLVIFIFLLISSNLFSQFTVINPSCPGACNGSATVLLSQITGTPPFTVSWDTNPVQIGVTATGLCGGVWYTCTVTDALGSSGSDPIILFDPATCGGSISGKVYKDDNVNCNQDSSEIGLANVIIQATPGPYYGTTDANGNYLIDVPLGNYVITQVSQLNYNEVCPLSGSYSIQLDSINNTSNNLDFGDSITIAQEVSISLNSGNPLVGNTFNYYISYTSINVTPLNGMIYLVVDDTLTFQSASVFPDVISGDTLYWNYTNLQQFETRNITATFLIPAEVGLLGDSLQACTQITPMIGDVNPINNTSCVSVIIAGSFDPNDKQVEPVGVGSTGDILLSQTELKYTVRFQNTGTAPATKVVVIDTLSSNLDVTTLRDVVASHPFTYGVSGQGILAFTFNNIMLPDSNANEPESHGLIQFTINQHPSNGIGAVIENTAEIYFDFNPAIVTNTTINTIVAITSIEENTFNSNPVNLYPNPSNGYLTISFQSEGESDIEIRVFDVVGKMVKDISIQKMPEGKYKKEMDISFLNSGVYFMSIKIGLVNHLKKIVIR